jgi:hypothetical protein
MSTVPQEPNDGRPETEPGKGTPATTESSLVREDIGRPDSPHSTLSFVFFDAATGSSVVPNSADVTLHAGEQSLPLTLTKPEEGDVFCLSKEAYSRLLDMFSSQQAGERLIVGLGRPCEAGCIRYSGVPVVLDVSDIERSCGAIPLPVYKLEEFSTLSIRAYDLSYTDMLENARNFLDGVGVLVTAVKVRSDEDKFADRMTPQTFSAQTLQGVAEIYELPLNQLYAVEFIDPPGYVCESPGPQYMYISGKSTREVRVGFRPCKQSPKRTLVFVRQECPGVRLGDLSFEVNGEQQQSNCDGVWNGLAGVTSTVELYAPGKTLSPCTIDLSATSSAVIQISVAEKTQKQLTAPVVSQFVSDAGTPFANRRLTVCLPGAQPYSIYTDARGYFRAPNGSSVEAHDDAAGLAAGPFLISQS